MDWVLPTAYCPLPSWKKWKENGIRRQLNTLVRQYHTRISAFWSFTHLPKPLKCFTVRFILTRPVHEAMTRKGVTLGAVMEFFLIDTALQYPALGIPVNGTVAMATLAVHGSFDGFGNALIFLEPALFFKPSYDFSCRIFIER
jgi:hypothetical protein